MSAHIMRLLSITKEGLKSSVLWILFEFHLMGMKYCLVILRPVFEGQAT